MMKAVKLLSVLITLFLGTHVAFAQSAGDVWVQIKARPSLAEATQEAENYAQNLRDVNGFALGGGWYAVALGPYSRAEADQVLINLRRRNLIPRDSYITFTSTFEAQFWPPAGTIQPVTAPENTPEQTPEVVVEETIVEVIEEPTEPEFRDPGETPREARASENLLTREEKKDLQRLLQWAGFYTSAIDGAYGRGTRRAMGAWQEANGYEATGIMTTSQRAEILAAYNAILDGMDMRLVSDFDAGIEIQIPTGVVTKTDPIYPFVSFEKTGDIDAQVLLISQAGNRTSLAGLYEIMQTLTIVPLNGSRKLNRNGFTILGEDNDIVSYTEVGLNDGEIKGFTLVWPTGDEERRRRILSEMQASFARLDGRLSPDVGLELLDDIDLLAGLEVRKPKFSRTGFFADARGTVVTTSEVVESCQRVTIGEDYVADVVGQDAATGVTILKPQEAIAPLSFANFRGSLIRRQSEVSVAGFSFEGLLGAPTLTYGAVEDLSGLGGEENLLRLSMLPQPADAGGPVFDMSGSVMGMLMARPGEGQRQLPDAVHYAAKSETIQILLADAGVSIEVAQPLGALDPVDLTSYASEMTTLVSCW